MSSAPLQAPSRGLNLGNVLFGLPDHPAQSWPGGEALAAAGFASARVPVKWHDFLDQDGQPLPAALAAVDAVVDELLGAGLEVVVDAHQWDPLYADPDAHAATLVSLWSHLARHWRDHPDALVLDLLNEPGHELGPQRWNDLAGRAATAVEEASPGRRMVVGTAAHGMLDALDDLVLPDVPGVIMGVHYYVPFRFTHQDADWWPAARAWHDESWGTAVDLAEVTADLTRVHALAVRCGVPAYLGEFGCIEHAPRPDRLRWIAHVRSEAERLGIGWCTWALGVQFASYDLEAGAWDDGVLGALGLPG